MHSQSILRRISSTMGSASAITRFSARHWSFLPMSSILGVNTSTLTVVLPSGVVWKERTRACQWYRNLLTLFFLTVRTLQTVLEFAMFCHERKPTVTHSCACSPLPRSRRNKLGVRYLKKLGEVAIKPYWQDVPQGLEGHSIFCLEVSKARAEIYIRPKEQTIHS